MRKLKKIILVRFTKLFLIVPLFLVQTNQQPVDNLTILNNLASTVVNKVIDGLTPDSTTSILIHSHSQQQNGNWWIENWFLKNLYQRGVSQIFLNKQNSSCMFVIEFQIHDVGVQYLPTYKKNIIKRQCKLNLAVRVFEASTGLVRFLHEFNEQFADSLYIRNVTKLENKDISFTQASLTEERGLKKLIEPFIVITTTAGIVYLFFRLRSN